MMEKSKAAEKKADDRKTLKKIWIILAVMAVAAVVCGVVLLTSSRSAAETLQGFYEGIYLKGSAQAIADEWLAPSRREAFVNALTYYGLNDAYINYYRTTAQMELGEDISIEVKVLSQENYSAKELKSFKETMPEADVMNSVTYTVTLSGSTGSVSETYTANMLKSGMKWYVVTYGFLPIGESIYAG